MSDQNNYVIITGGHTDDRFAKQVIAQGAYDVILAADSGMNFLYRNQILPDIIIGDFDSVKEEALRFFREHKEIEFHQLIPEKDDTDTEYAIRFAIAQGAKQITILGATGTRMDHVLGTIGLLGIGLETDTQLEILDEHNRIRMIDKPVTIRKEKQFGNYISILPVSKTVEQVVLEGFKYPLNGYQMTQFNSLGISNEIVEEEAKITFSDGILLVVESRD